MPYGMAQVILDQVTHLMLTCCKLGFFTKKPRQQSTTLSSLEDSLVKHTPQDKAGKQKRKQTGHSNANKTAKLERGRFLVTFILTEVLVDTARGHLPPGTSSVLLDSLTEDKGLTSSV